MKHLIKIESTPHGVLGVRHAGHDQQYCEAGEQVILKWQPDAKWGLQEVHYTDGDGNVTAIDLTRVKVNGVDEVVFAMPDANITIGGTFKRFVLQDWTEGQNPSVGDILVVGKNGEPVPSLSVNENRFTNKIILEPGMFDPNGFLYGAISLTSLFKKEYVTTKFIKFDSRREKIYSITGYGTGSLSIFCYDKDFAHIGKANDLQFVDGTRYVRIDLLFSSEQQVKKISLDIVASMQIEFVKRGVCEGRSLLYQSFEINIPTITSDGTVNYNGNGERCYTNGYIALPPNYSREGNPVPLIILGHGTDCFAFTSYSEPPYFYGNLITFLTKCGFAVSDVSTLSSKYYNLAGVHDCNFPTALTRECYARLYSKVVDDYNIDTNRVFMSGHSGGGMITCIFSFLRPFPLKAVAGLAPSTELITNMRILSNASDHNFFLSQIGLSNPSITGVNPLRTPDPAAKQYYVDNADAFKGYNPFTFGSANIDNETLVDEVLNVGFSTANYEASTELTNLVDGGYKMQPVPMKIWQAVDDANVPIATSRWYKKIVENAGGCCILRELPAGCGQHGAVSIAPNAPTTTYVTPFGESVTINICWAEMVDWFLANM